MFSPRTTLMGILFRGPVENVYNIIIHFSVVPIWPLDECCLHFASERSNYTARAQPAIIRSTTFQFF